VLPGRWYKEVLEPTSPAARTVAVYEDGSPAAVVSSFGKGRTLCVGTYLSAAYQTGPTPEAAAFFAALLDWAGVSRPVTVTGSDLEVRHLESTRHVLLFALNHGMSRADARITLRRPISGDTAFDLIAGRDVPLGRADGAVSLAVQLDPGMVTVVRMASA
jgi:hypothetical protein